MRQSASVRLDGDGYVAFIWSASYFCVNSPLSVWRSAYTEPESRHWMSNPAQRLESDLLAYPGMQVDETVVWRAWALLHQTEYDRFDHNIRIGPGKEVDASFLPSVRRSEFLNSQMRIDSVGWQAIDPAMLPLGVTDPQKIYDVFPSALATIFEVKRRADLRAYGELMGYAHAWEEDFPNAPAPTLRIVCASYAQTILPATRASSVQVDVVQANFSVLSTPRGTIAG